MQLASQLLSQGNNGEASRLLERYGKGTAHARLRGFEWHYLEQRLHGERLTLRGHRGQVYGVAFSPDGKQVASGGEDGQIKLWDAATGDEIRSIQAHSSCANQLAFSADGRWLASASCDKTIKLWKTDSWSVERTLDDHPSEVLTLAFSPDGHHLASGCKDGSILIWALPQGRCVQRLQPDTTTVDVVTFSPDGGLLAAGIGTRCVRLWDTATWQKRLEIPVESTALAFIPDDNRLAMEMSNGKVVLMDTASGKIDATLTGHIGRVQAIAVSADGQLLATAGGNGTTAVWNLGAINEGSTTFGIAEVSRGLERTLIGHTQRTQALAFSPDTSALASASFDGTVRLWDLTKQDAALPVLQFPSEPRGMLGLSAALSPDLSRMWLASPENAVTVWDVQMRREIAHYDTSTGSELAISPDGQFLIGNPPDAQGFSVTGLASSEPMTRLGAQLGMLRRFAFSPSGKSAAMMGNDGVIGVWDLASHAERFVANAFDGMAVVDRPIRTGLDAAWPVFTSDDRLLLIWLESREFINLSTGERSVAHVERVADLSCVCSSPSGALVATISHSQVVTLIDATTGRTMHSLHPSGKTLTAAFSPDDRTLVTGDDEGRFVLWHVPTGQEMTTLHAVSGTILAIRFAEDGLALASALQHPDKLQGSLYVWSIQPD